jgi:hypothetical protein
MMHQDAILGSRRTEVWSSRVLMRGLFLLLFFLLLL